MKKRTSTIICALAILCLATSCFVGSTFAKYTSGAASNNTTVATVAAWSFEVGNGTDMEDITGYNTTTNKFDFSLNSTITDNNNNNIANGTIAPGAAGSYSFVIQNTSDVTAEYNFTLANVWPAEVGVSSPITITAISADNGDTTNVAAGTGTGTLEAAEDVTITVTWEWTTTSDSDDTTIGRYAAAHTLNWDVNLTITATQVDS